MTGVLLVLVLGISTLFWSIVGVGRVVSMRLRRDRRDPRHRHSSLMDARWPEVPSPDGVSSRGNRRVMPAGVAVLVAAHNEGLVIGETIRAASRLVNVENIFVISDGSSDETAEVARAAGANVLELHPNRGKAGALAAGIDHFELCRRFEVVLLLDADTHLAADYLLTGLPLFDDPGVAAVAGRAMTIPDQKHSSLFGRFLVAYRERLYLIVQLMMKFGQAARWANAVTIVPGFASMYRTSALAQIDVVGAGLVIEDFNMTFEVHVKRLGRIEFHPSVAIAYTQDPDHFGEYVRQVRRWILGFWQTVRRHRVGMSVFGVTVTVFIIELITSSIMFVLLVPTLVVSVLAAMVQSVDPDPSSWTFWLSGLLHPQDVLIGVLVPDFLLTIIAAVALRRPAFLVLGLAFPLMRIVDAALCLRVLPKAWIGRSTGVWVSPTRRAIPVAVSSGTGG